MHLKISSLTINEYLIRDTRSTSSFNFSQANHKILTQDVWSMTQEKPNLGKPVRESFFIIEQVK